MSVPILVKKLLKWFAIEFKSVQVWPSMFILSMVEEEFSLPRASFKVSQVFLDC